jgi:hypothetical protein
MPGLLWLSLPLLAACTGQQTMKPGPDAATLHKPPSPSSPPARENEPPAGRATAPEDPWSPFTLDARLIVWKPQLRGHVALDRIFGAETDNELTAPRVDLVDAARMDDPGTVLGVELAVGLYKCYGIGVSYWQGRWNASGTLEKALDLGTSVVPAGSPMESALLFRKVGLEWAIIMDDILESSWGFDLRLGLRTVSFNFDMKVPGGRLEDDSGSGPLGLDIGVRYNPFSFVRLSGEFSLTGTFGIAVLETSLAAGVEWKGLRLEAGYRALWACMHAWTEEISLFLGGPWVCAGVRF